MESFSLAVWHRRRGARFPSGARPSIPLSFGSLESEYRAAKEAVGLVDRSSVGRIKATGPDTLDLLNRLSTNSVETLLPGSGVPTVLTNNKGRIIDRLEVIRPDDSALLFTSPGATQPVTEWIDKYTIVEDITLEETTPHTAMVGVLGPKAAGLLGELFGAAVRGLPRYHCLRVPWRDAELLMVRTDAVGLRGYDLVVSAGQAETLCDVLLEAGASWGMVPVGEEALEVLRVEAGVPRRGHELSEEYNPLEAGLLDAISWTKGCYIGQEVIARLHTYHKVQRYLVTIALDGQNVPPTGSRLLVDGKEAGVLTSSVYSPGFRRPLALGYLRTAYVKEGRQVDVSPTDGQASSGTVIRAPELPEAALSPARLLALAEEEAAAAE
ncbi:MAG: aminomethyl transferase family protein [Chloroflexi bacterium]|nr:aminomethyl transferase family protein [Chloroflexota bacterium]